MSAPRGNKFSAGRPKGARSKRTQEWEKFAQWMMGSGLDKFSAEIKKLKGKDLINVMLEMMEYFQPKLSRTEHTGLEDEPIKFEEVDPKGLTEKEKLDYLAKILGVHKDAS